MMTVVERVHRAVRALKHWQAFLLVVCLIGVLGYPLYMLGNHLLKWEMSFADSPAPAIVLYKCYGIWFDTVLATAGKPNRIRLISALLLLMFAGVLLWLRKDQTSPDFVYIVPLYLLAIAWILWVAVPTAKALRSMEQTPRSAMPFWIDVVLIAVYFPFGLWVLQPRLNQTV